MDDSLDFYETFLGLPLNNRFNAGPHMEIAFLGDGDTQVELIYNSEVKDIGFGNDISLGFTVPSLEEMIGKLETIGIKPLTDIYQPNPNVRFIFIQDPNGLKIQFVEMK